MPNLFNYLCPSIRTCTAFFLCLYIVGCGKALTPTHIVTETDNAYSSAQSFEQVTMNFSGTIENTYNEAITLERLDWHLFSNDKKIQSGTQPLNLEVDTGKQGEVDLALNIPTATVHEAEVSPAPLTEVRLEGTLVINANGKKTTKEIYWVGEHFSPMQPKLTLDAGTARRANMAELVFTLSLQNTNQFKLIIDRLEYTMHVMGVEVAKGTAAQGQVLRAGAIFEYDVSKLVGKTDFFDLAKTIGRADSIPYEAKIKIYSGHKTWDREFKDQIVF